MPEEGPLLKVKRLRAEDADVELPRYTSAAAAGMDLHAACPGPVRIAPGERAKIPTGFAMELPPGHEGQIRPRSGLADKHGVTLVNAPGTLDQDFRGEVCVLLINLGSAPYVVERNSRIAQLVIAPVSRARVAEVETLDSTMRGSGGFGSSGT